MESDREARLKGLLETQHTFPGLFFLSVIAHNDPPAFDRIRAAIEAGLPAPLVEGSWEARSSSAGKYSSYRFHVPCDSADDVIALYDRVVAVEGVVTVL